MFPDNFWLPLFPLNTVLFPDGVLPLRVFEVRYIDMVRDCMKSETPFGVVRIVAGAEVGKAAQPDQVGCLAHITNWDMPEMGVLLLNTRGGQRFRILETRVLTDQRIEARVELMEPDARMPLPEKHAICASALKAVIEDINAQGAAEQGDAFLSPFPEALELDDTAWVANRWCEILPVPLPARQKLLELGDGESRIAVVHQYLEQHKIV